MDSKGIATVDLIFATLFAVIIIASMVNLINTELAQTNAGDFGHARMVGEKVASAINTAYINGNGYAVNITLSNSISYTIVTNSTGYLTVNFNGQSAKIKVLSQNITNITMNAGSRYLIKNNNGAIVITAL